MATNKTLAPTNVTVQIPALSDVPDMSVPANAIDKTIDAVNTVNSQVESVAITNQYSTVLAAINAYRTTKKIPFAIQKYGNTAITDLPTGVTNTCEWNLICYGTSIRLVAVLTIFTGGSSMNGWSYTANIYDGGYVRDWFSPNEQITYDSGLQTIALSSSSQVKYRKIGNIVHVSVVYDPTVDGGVNSWSNKEIGALPAGFRPCFNICVRAVPDRVNASDFASITVDSGGKVMINSRNQAIDQSQGNVLYGWLVFAAFS